MFIPSSKVIVLDSTTKRKAGPRIGSIGYIQNISHITTIIFEEPGSPIHVEIYKANIFFTRFGFEDKKRLEEKDVAIVELSIRYKPIRYVKKLSGIVNIDILESRVLEVIKKINNNCRDVLLLGPIQPSEQSILDLSYEALASKMTICCRYTNTMRIFMNHIKHCSLSNNIFSKKCTEIHKSFIGTNKKPTQKLPAIAKKIFDSFSDSDRVEYVRFINHMINVNLRQIISAICRDDIRTVGYLLRYLHTFPTNAFLVERLKQSEPNSMVLKNSIRLIEGRIEESVALEYKH